MKNLHWVYIALLFIILSCDESSTIEVQDLFATQQYNQIEGVDNNLLSLDIYYNSLIEEKKPVIIYVHGGAWSIGDKANKIENKANLFQSANEVFVSVNYRLSPFPLEPDNLDRIKYPTHNNDLADAIKWVVDNISEYGGDPSSIALLGHSAGAHLVALTGTNPTFLEGVGLSLSNIKGVATIDTEGYDVVAQIAESNDFYLNAFGTDANDNRDASPLFNIQSGTAYPSFFIAKRGTLERIAIADSFAEALQDAGVSVTVLNGNAYTHEEINDAIGKPLEKVITPSLRSFFTEVLY